MPRKLASPTRYKPRRSMGLLVVVSVLLAFTPSASASIQFVKAWGSTGSGDGQFHSPTGVAIAASGNVRVSDYHRIQTFDSSGTFLARWGSFQGELTPTSIAIDSSDNVYVTDSPNERIEKFDSSGTLVSAWGWGVEDGAAQYEVCTSACQPGIRGSGDGQFRDPIGIATDVSGKVYVADTSNHRIQEFDPSGNFITQWGSYGFDDGEFNEPRAVAVDSSGTVYVADFGDRIQKFSPAGAFLGKWGSPGSGDGQFYSPTGIAMDSAGNFYVADAGNDRIQKFDPSGAFLAKWGSPGAGEGQFDRPMGIATDPSGDVYVADMGNDRIEKFNDSATVGASGSTLVVTATAGERDNIAITRPTPTTLRVTDFSSGPYSGSPIRAGTRCSRNGANTANCYAPGVTRIQVSRRGPGRPGGQLDRDRKLALRGQGR